MTPWTISCPKDRRRSYKSWRWWQSWPLSSRGTVSWSHGRLSCLLTASQSGALSLRRWSANDNSDDMISVIFEVEEGFDIPLWIERVPSQSNPSDVLSREVVAVFEGAERVRVNPREIWKSLVEWSAMVVTPEPITGEKARAVGMRYHRKFPTFKKKRECACLQGFTVHGLLHTSYMAASVGPKAQ